MVGDVTHQHGRPQIGVGFEYITVHHVDNLLHQKTTLHQSLADHHSQAALALWLNPMVCLEDNAVKTRIKGLRGSRKNVFKHRFDRSCCVVNTSTLAVAETVSLRSCLPMTGKTSHCPRTITREAFSQVAQTNTCGDAAMWIWNTPPPNFYQ
eukprot:6460559-Amphidinium_carterae.1